MRKVELHQCAVLLIVPICSCSCSYILKTLMVNSWTICRPVYVIEDTAGQTLFSIRGDLCWCKCCTDVMFPVSTHDNGILLNIDLCRMLIDVSCLIRNIVACVQGTFHMTLALTTFCCSNGTF